ncbi:MAG: preprotein translocase subunit YajC [Candidatus Omnitrophica bacterium]|nr:preprotein translocase subunit YajC [Candidatus Omnitrophota bacterium]
MRQGILFVLTMAAADVYAQGGAPAGGPGGAPAPDPWQGMGQFLLMMGSIFAIFYFLLIRPQQKQRKKHEDQVNSLKKGERVVAAGGIYGSIIGIKDDKAVIKIAENVKIEVLKSSITHIISGEESK